MKKLLLLLLLFPFFAEAQINGTLQKTVATGTIRGSFGTSGIDTLPPVRLTGITNGMTLIYNSTTKKFHATAVAATVSFAAFGSTPNANGASVASGVITLQPASATMPGGITTGAQTFGGVKTIGNLFVTDVLYVGDGTSQGYIRQNRANTGSTGYTSFETNFVSKWRVGLASGSDNYIINNASATNAIEINQSTNAVTIGGDVSNTSTGFLRIPVGTTAQRPATPLDGMRRYNTTTLRDEFYANGSWQNHARLTGDTFTGTVTAPSLTIGTNSLSSSTNGIYQAVSDDHFKQYAFATVADRGEYVFETGDNGFPWASNGQRWRYSYTAGTSGVAKDVLLIDYDAITTPNPITAGGYTQTGTSANTLTGALTGTSATLGSSLAFTNSTINTVSTNAAIYHSTNTNLYIQGGAGGLAMYGNGARAYGIILDNATNTINLTGGLIGTSATFSSLGTGAVQATAGVLSVTSDSLAKDVKGLFVGSALDAIAKIPKPKYWNYNAKSKLPVQAYSVNQFGLLADNVYKVLGEEFAPTQAETIDGKPVHGLSDRALLSLTIQALQEANAKITALEARIKALELR